MGVPVSQMWTVASYVLKQRLHGRKRYPLVLMLEPLFRCNLACAGCGKIQYPAHVLKQQLTPEECFRAVEECGAPMVSIPGGEPLLHPQVDVIVDELVKRKKYVYLCTNAEPLRRRWEKFSFTPSRYFSFAVHIDGLRERHDASVAQDGVFDKAIDAIKFLKEQGFRVTTNSTFFTTDTPQTVIDVLNFLNDEVQVDQMMISPAYAYEKAPDQDHFLGPDQTRALFKEAFADGIRAAVDGYWNWQQSRSGKRAGKRVGFPGFAKKGRDPRPGHLHHRCHPHRI